jgi:hypothetical protein
MPPRRVPTPAEVAKDFYAKLKTAYNTSSGDTRSVNTITKNIAQYIGNSSEAEAKQMIKELLLETARQYAGVDDDDARIRGVPQGYVKDNIQKLVETAIKDSPGAGATRDIQVAARSGLAEGIEEARVIYNAESTATVERARARTAAEMAESQARREARRRGVPAGPAAAGAPQGPTAEEEAAAAAQDAEDQRQDAAAAAQEAANTSETGMALGPSSSDDGSQTAKDPEGPNGGRRRKTKKSRKGKKRTTRRAKKTRKA